MNLVSHLSQSLKERYGLSGEEAYRLARSIEDSDAWECAGGSCELSEEGLAGSLEERLTDRSMDTMPMARFMASELRSYVSLFKMHDGKFNSALAKRIQEHYSDYGVSRMDSYVLAAAFAASSAGHDFQSDLNNFKHIERSMEHSVETYLKNSEGPFPGLDMNDVAGFVFEQVWGTKPDEDGRKLAMSDGPSISAAPNYSPEDYITVDVTHYKPVTMDGVTVSDTRELDSALRRVKSGKDEKSEEDDGVRDGFFAGTMPAVEPNWFPETSPASPTPGPSRPPLRLVPDLEPEGPSSDGQTLEARSRWSAALGLLGEAAGTVGVGAFFIGALNLPNAQSKWEGADVAWEKSGSTTVHIIKPGRETTVRGNGDEVRQPRIDPEVETLAAPEIPIARDPEIDDPNIQRAAPFVEPDVEPSEEQEAPPARVPEIDLRPGTRPEEEVETEETMQPHRTLAPIAEAKPETENVPEAEPSVEETVSTGEGLAEETVEDSSALEGLADGVKDLGRKVVETFEGVGVLVEETIEEVAGRVEKSIKALNFDSGSLDVERQNQVEEFLAGRELSSLTPKEKSALVRHLYGESDWGHKELQKFIGPEGMKVFLGYGSEIPFGFESREQYDVFQKELLRGLIDAGIPIFDPEVVILVQGSAVTGWSNKTGEPFRWEGEDPSDLDVAVVVSPRIFTEMVVRRVQWILNANFNVDADMKFAIRATLKWLKTIKVDPNLEKDPVARQNIVWRAESREMLEEELTRMIGEDADADFDTKNAEGLEWWQRPGDREGEVKRTKGARNLNRALAGKKLDIANTDAAWRGAYGELRDEMKAENFERNIQTSFMLEDSKFFPQPDEAMLISAGTLYPAGSTQDPVH